MAQTRPKARSNGSWRFEGNHPLGSSRADKFPLGINGFQEITLPNWVYKEEMALLLRHTGYARWEIVGGFHDRELTKETDAMIVRAWVVS